MNTDLRNKFRQTAGTPRAAGAPAAPDTPGAPGASPGAEAGRKADMLAPADPAGYGVYGRIPPRRWFLTFMCMNIPIAGWIYLLHLAFSKKRHQLRDFARAYLIYKLIFLIVALILLGILVYVGLGLADKLLAYMDML